MPDVGLELHLGWRVRVILGKGEARFEESAWNALYVSYGSTAQYQQGEHTTIQSTFITNHQHNLPLEQITLIHKSNANPLDMIIRRHKL